MEKESLESDLIQNSTVVREKLSKDVELFIFGWFSPFISH